MSLEGIVNSIVQVGGPIFAAGKAVYDGLYEGMYSQEPLDPVGGVFNALGNMGKGALALGMPYALYNGVKVLTLGTLGLTGTYGLLPALGVGALGGLVAGGVAGVTAGIYGAGLGLMYSLVKAPIKYVSRAVRNVYESRAEAPAPT